MTLPVPSEQMEPLSVVAQAVTSKGWDLGSDDDALFQDNVPFTARTHHIGYSANMSHLTDNVLHLELTVQLGAYSPFLRSPLGIVINLVNRYISIGAICHDINADGSEFLIHRMQLLFDSEVGVTENLVTDFMEACIVAFDLCVPHIAEFLAVKPSAVLDDSGEVSHVQLKIDPEDVLDYILAGPQIGHA